MLMIAVSGMVSQVCWAQDHSNQLLLLRCVEFDGTPSVQEESKELIFRWSFGDGSPDDYGKVVEHCYDSLGTFEASLSVIEPVTKITFMEEHNILIDVQPDLLLDFTTQPISKNEVRFLPTLQGDLKYQQVTHFWDFGDGEYAVEDSPTHVFQTEGEFTVRLLTRLVIEDEEYQLAKKILIKI